MRAYRSAGTSASPCRPHPARSRRTRPARPDFLQNIQRLLGKGAFTATYKYALLLALADICVERGEDTGAGFRVETSWMAEKCIAYYWRQTRPYAGFSAQTQPVGDAILRQNTGQPAAVLTALKRLAETGLSLADAQRSSATWRAAVAKVARIVREMPLWKLQVIGQKPVEFLYAHAGAGESIELKPGVIPITGVDPACDAPSSLW